MAVSRCSPASRSRISQASAHAPWRIDSVGELLGPKRLQRLDELLRGPVSLRLSDEILLGRRKPYGVEMGEEVASLIGHKAPVCWWEAEGPGAPARRPHTHHSSAQPAGLSFKRVPLSQAT